MRVLWLCNGVLPAAASAFDLKPGHGGGWLVGMSERLKITHELHFAFMHNDIVSLQVRDVDEIKFYAVPRRVPKSHVYDASVERYFQDIISTVQPDIIHIFGTEYPHTLAMMNVCPVDKTVVSIQGLVSVIQDHYIASLPFFFRNNLSVKNLLRRILIRMQKDRFAKRGLYEIEAIKKAKHVIGRTFWDYACTKQINPGVTYHFCNETLRSEFYKHRWDIKACRRYSVFVSQGEYPVKGLHILLQALPKILKIYPETHVYIAGSNVANEVTFTNRVGISYGMYLREEIESKSLSEHVTFLGELNEKDMCNQYLRANVFVSASSIENSPNSLGEAMILGVPSVVSCVGGVQDMLIHKEEGFLYPFDEPYMLAHYVCEIFSSDDLALRLSKQARNHAMITHDTERNTSMLSEIYEVIESR